MDDNESESGIGFNTAPMMCLSIPTRDARTVPQRWDRFRHSLVLVACGFCLSACPTVELGDTPVDPGNCRPSVAYFNDVIWPEFLAPANETASCVSEAACHRRDDGRSSLRFATSPVNLTENYEVTTRFLNCGSAEASSLVTKPLSGVDAHGGGDLFNRQDPQFTTFITWFSAP